MKLQWVTISLITFIYLNFRNQGFSDWHDLYISTTHPLPSFPTIDQIRIYKETISVCVCVFFQDAFYNFYWCGPLSRCPCASLCVCVSVPKVVIVVYAQMVRKLVFLIRKNVLYGFKDSKYWRTSKLHGWFKNIFWPFYHFDDFLRFEFFLRFWVFTNQPTVHSGEVNRGRVCGCGSWCIKVTGDMW